jgi:hypothetical protein
MERTVVSTSHLGIPDLDKTGASFLAVLVKSAIGDHYAAYCGLVKLPDASDAGYDKARAKKAERVAASGSKMTYKQCVDHFPATKECQYG